jgi:hypothetical protein
VEVLFEQAMREAPHDSIVIEYLDAMQSFYDKEAIVSELLATHFVTYII